MGFRLGPGRNAESTMGPLITKGAFTKIESHVKDALGRGSRVLISGQQETALGGAFFQPTLLVGVPPDASCAREETFGPLPPTFRFRTDEAKHLGGSRGFPPYWPYWELASGGRTSFKSVRGRCERFRV